jgi:WD40 repeat protein
VSFHGAVRPILERRCQGCHQPAKQGGKLDVTSFDALKAGGKKGAGFLPGKPGESLLVQVLTGEEKPRMPKGEPPLAPAEIEIIARWVAEGARDDTPPNAKLTFDLTRPPVYAVPPVVSALAFSPAGDLMATAGYHEVILREVEAPEEVEPAARLVGMSDRIETILFSPDGTLLAAIGGSPCRFGEVQIWEVAGRKLLRSATVGFDSLYGASFSDDGKFIAFGSTDKSVQVLSVEEGKVVRRIDQHEDWVFGTGFSRDGKHLITCSRDRTVKLIEADTGSFVDNLTSITPGVLGGPLFALVRHPAEDKFLTGGEDGVPKLYKTVRTAARAIGDDNNLLRAYEKLPGVITTLAMSPDGKLLAAGSITGVVRVHETETGRRVSEAKTPGAVYTVKFHPDGARIAAGGFDGKVRFIEAATGKALREIVPVPLSPVARAPSATNVDREF